MLMEKDGKEPSYFGAH